jgi:ABC-type phosphate transport system permease subunit
MRLNLKALTIASGILWGLAIFLTGMGNLMWSDYGNEFLQIIASLYPGFDAKGSFGDVIVGTLYALVDGAACGLVFGWIYNVFVREKEQST